MDPRLASLPVLGTGASLSFGIEPDPVALASHPAGPSFIEYASAVNVGVVANAVRRLEARKVPVLYHPSCLNLCGERPNPAPWLAAVDHHVKTVGSAWLAQDVAVCFAGDEPGYSNHLGYFIPPIFSADGLAHAVDRVTEAQAALSVPLLIEPPPVGFLVGDMDPIDWFSTLAERTGVGLLLDCGHLVSLQLARGLGRDVITAGLDRLPFDRVIELHVAGGAIESLDDSTVYVDAHELPVLPETWQVFRYLLERTPSLKAVCVECEGALAQSVRGLLAQVRARAEAASVSSTFVDVVRAERARAGDVS